MADLKISELGAAGALDGSELVEVVKSGTNVQTTTQDIADLGGAGTSIPYGATSGTNTYTIAATPAVTSYTNGMLLLMRVGNSSTNVVTLNFDSVGAKKLLDTAGNQAMDGYLKAGVDYLISYNPSLDSSAGAFTVVNEIKHGLMNLRAVYAASGGAYPSGGGSGPAGAIRHGDTFVISGTDTIGSLVVRAGDLITSIVDSPGQTASNWYWYPGATTMATKQDTLVSGTNIKTINSTSLLGSGDISVGGSGTPAGADTNVQYNDGGSFGAEAAFTYNKTTNTLHADIVTVNDDAYASGWNASTAVPTKNAVYDKIESMANSAVISNALVSTTLTADGSGKSGQIQFHDSTAISSNITYAISNMTDVTAFVQTILVTGTVVISFDNSVVMQKADTRWDNTSSSKDITLTAPDTGNPYVFSFIKCGSLWLMQASGAHYTS